MLLAKRRSISGYQHSSHHHVSWTTTNDRWTVRICYQLRCGRGAQQVVQHINDYEEITNAYVACNYPYTIITQDILSSTNFRSSLSLLGHHLRDQSRSLGSRLRNRQALAMLVLHSRKIIWVIDEVSARLQRRLPSLARLWLFRFECRHQGR